MIIGLWGKEIRLDSAGFYALSIIAFCIDAMRKGRGRMNRALLSFMI